MSLKTVSFLRAQVRFPNLLLVEQEHESPAPSSSDSINRTVRSTCGSARSTPPAPTSVSTLTPSPAVFDVRDGRAQVFVGPAFVVNAPNVGVARLDAQADPDQSPRNELAPAVAIGPGHSEFVQERVDAVEAWLLSVVGPIGWCRRGSSARSEMSGRSRSRKLATLLKGLMQHVASRQEETRLCNSRRPQSAATSSQCRANSAVERV